MLCDLYGKVTSASGTVARLGLIVGSIVLVGGITGGVVVMSNVMNIPEMIPPSDSFIVWEDNSAWEDSMQNIVRVGGVITNTHSEWGIKNVKIKLEATDDEGNVIKIYDVPAIPSAIPPGGKGVYLKTLPMPYCCVTGFNPVIEWEWVPP
jgi:hypothetical protein